MIQCVPKTWGFAHVCEECSDIGPIVGDFAEMRDEAECKALGIACGGPGSGCSAHTAGWVTGTGRDLCPACRPKPGLIDRVRDAFT